MHIEFLNARGVSRRLRGLIEAHDEIHVAVAWGHGGPIADCLMSNKHKFASVTFGLAFCETDPDLIARLVDVRNAFVATAVGGTFHPKIYYFRTGDTAEAIVGSANFTRGGLGRNWEACVYLKGAADAPIFRQLRSGLDSYDSLRTPITQALADSYRLQHDVAKSKPRPRDPVLPTDGAPWRQLTSSLVKMSWDDYVRAVRSSRHHKFSERLSLLRACQQLFAGVSSFGDLSVREWQAIAATIGENQRQEARLENYEWGWFGSMSGMGDFTSLVLSRDSRLGTAIDGIPRHGDVTQTQFERYCELFVEAFENSAHVGGVPTATRLLAMKRPDTFVCISSPNKAGLAKGLSFARTTLSLENYWQRVIEPIRLSRWYNAPRPDGRNAELWDGRVAMLDAIYYAPPQRESAG